MSQFMYATRPTIIEAFPFDTIEDEKTQAIPQWLLAAIKNSNISYRAGSWYCQNTDKGVLKINVGDWLIRTEEGKIYPVSAETFAQTFVKYDGLSSVKS